MEKTVSKPPITSWDATAKFLQINNIPYEVLSRTSVTATGKDSKLGHIKKSKDLTDSVRTQTHLLTDADGQSWLVITASSSNVDLAKLSAHLKASSLKVASAKEAQDLLDCSRVHMSLYAMQNDAQK